MTPTILTMPEVAAMTRTPVATLRYWRAARLGPRSFKYGRKVVYFEHEVAAWLQEAHDNDPLGSVVGA